MNYSGVLRILKAEKTSLDTCHDEQPSACKAMVYIYLQYVPLARELARLSLQTAGPPLTLGLHL